MYFKIFWKSWNKPSYSRECLLYWLHWHLVLKRVHLLSTCEGPHRGTTYHGCEDTLEFDTGVAWASLPTRRIHPEVAPESKIQWIRATLQNTGWMDHCPVHHGRFEAIPMLDPVDVEEAYGHIASSYDGLQWHVHSYGWCYASFS